MHDVGRFVGLAAVRNRSEVRRVRFNEDAIRRNVARNLLQRFRLLEADHTGERHIETKLDGAACEFGAARVAVKHAGERAVGFHLVVEQRDGVRVRLAGVDFKRKARFARGRDVRAEAFRLRLGTPVLVEVVEARFTNRDDLRMMRQADDLACGNAALLVRVVRMRADRAPDIVVALGDGADLVELPDARGDRDHGAHAGRFRARDDAVQIGRELWKVQVAVVINKHARLLPHPRTPEPERELITTSRLRRPSAFAWAASVSAVRGRRLLRPPPDRHSAGTRLAARDRRAGHEASRLPELREGAFVRTGAGQNQIEQLGGQLRHHGLSQDGELAHDFRRHVENGLHALRVGLLLGPRLFGREVAVGIRDDAPDGVEIAGDGLLIHRGARFSVERIGCRKDGRVLGGVSRRALGSCRRSS